MVLAAKLGSVENALNAQQDGISMPLESVKLFLTNADHGMPLVNANHAIQVTSSLLDNVFKIQTHSFQLKTISAQSGVTESVLNALIELSSIQTEFANKFLPNAQLGIFWTEFA